MPIPQSADALALDEALQRLEETAEALGVSVETVRRDWSLARAWLSRELKQKSQ